MKSLIDTLMYLSISVWDNTKNKFYIKILLFEIKLKSFLNYSLLDAYEQLKYDDHLLMSIAHLNSEDMLWNSNKWISKNIFMIL